MYMPKGKTGTVTQADSVPVAQQNGSTVPNQKLLPVIAMFIAPVGAVGGEVFGVYEDTLMTILKVSDGIY